METPFTLHDSYGTDTNPLSDEILGDDESTTGIALML